MIASVGVGQLRKIKIFFEFWGLADFTGGNIDAKTAWKLATIETE